MMFPIFFDKSSFNIHTAMSNLNLYKPLSMVLSKYLPFFVRAGQMLSYLERIDLSVKTFLIEITSFSIVKSDKYVSLMFLDVKSSKHVLK